MADPQKFCAVRLGADDAMIRLRLSRVLAAGESATFTLTLEDMFRHDPMMAISEATLGPGGQEVDLAIQSAATGLALAYSIEGFARVVLRWRATFINATTATAQFVLSNASHSFPRLNVDFAVPIGGPPPSLVWILGRGRPLLPSPT
jgi:hypothetical protein